MTPWTLRMRRLLLLALPWMVMTAGAQEVLRPAEVAMTHLGNAQAWRQGDQCFVNPNVLIAWKWPYSFVGNEATIQAEGRTVRVIGRTINSRFLLPLNEIYDQLGVSYKWRSDRDVMEALSRVRRIQYKDGQLETDATVSFAPNILFLANPSRIVIDLKGAQLDERCQIDLPANGRAANFGPDTVRVVIESESKPTVEKGVPMRSLALKLEGEGVVQQANPPIQSETVPVAPPVGPTNTVSPLRQLARSESSLTITAAIKGSVPMNPQITRVDPLTLELKLPKTLPDESAVPPTIDGITVETTSDAQGTTLRLVTDRPMGLQFSSSATSVQLTLVKPKVGDGRMAGKVIVVDPGHGGNDPGARSPAGEVFEKQLNLAISKLIAKELSSQGATVIETRDTDVFIPLKERAEIANRNNAAFFVSVHINSNRVNNSASGTITFYRGGNSMSQLLADCIHNEIKKIPNMPSMGVWSDTRIYDTGFAVLRYSKMPGVLLELGFINNSKDRKRMMEKDYQDHVARAVVKGIRVYLGDVKP